MSGMQRLISGFRAFHKDYYGPGGSDPQSMREGQRPKTMIIGCSDSRVDPAILTNCEPGEIFTVRNVANLVPPFEEPDGQHGVSAALEFAVCHLHVEHIIVLGHSQCGGIDALMSGYEDCMEGGFVSHWMSIAEPAREKIRAQSPGDDAAMQQRATEQASILLSLENLRSFPFIAERVASGRLSLHGWYFDLAHGELLEYRPESGAFQTLGG